jgi:hypothetical protein
MSSFALLCQFESDFVAFFNDQIQIRCHDGHISIPRVISKAFFANIPDFFKFSSHIVAAWIQSLLIDCPEASQDLMWRANTLNRSEQLELIKIYNECFALTRNTLHFHKQFFIDFGKSVVSSIHSEGQGQDTEYPHDARDPQNSQDTLCSDSQKDLADLFHFLPSSLLDPTLEKVKVVQDLPFSEFKNLHTLLPTLVDSKRGPKVNTTMLFHPASYTKFDPTKIIISKISNRLQRLGIGSVDTSYGFSHCIQAKNAKATKVLVDFSSFTNTKIEVSPAYIFASMAKCPVLNTKETIQQYLTNPKGFNLSKLSTNKTLSKVVGHKVYFAFLSEIKDIPTAISDNLNIVEDIFKIFDCTIVTNPTDADFIIHYTRTSQTDHRSVFLSDLMA